MSDYNQYLTEREKIDGLVREGFQIKEVQENLSGAFVHFINSANKVETLHILTADARKYFSALILKQNALNEKSE
jgi:hypothetical protein